MSDIAGELSSIEQTLVAILDALRGIEGELIGSKQRRIEEVALVFASASLNNGGSLAPRMRYALEAAKVFIEECDRQRRELHD